MEIAALLAGHIFSSNKKTTASESIEKAKSNWKRNRSNV
jgi:hypothetical protein